MLGSGDGVLNRAGRERALAAMATSELDLLIVGGGITGAGAALDAAARGLNVGLVEKDDLAAGASSKSSKLIHGGLRYLEMGDLGLVREGLRERELLLTRLAPHLVTPVPFLWPLRGRVWERVYLGAGLMLYDTLGGARSVPRHRHLSRRRALAAAPALSGDGMIGAVQFHDAAEDDARMVVAVARAAAAHGAHIATRARMAELLSAGGRVGGARVVDGESGRTLTIRARHVALAVGAWTDAVGASAPGGWAPRMRPSKGIHITVARERIPMSTGVLARTEKSVLFVIPTPDGWLIGDTDTPWAHGPDEVIATGADVDYLLAKVNALLAQPLSRADVRGVFAGIRPLVGAAGGDVGDTTRLSRQHVVQAAAPGLTVIAGGKYTTYRVMAADLIDAAVSDRARVPPSSTADIPLAGAAGFAAAWAQRTTLASRSGLSLDMIERLLRRYGDGVHELVALVQRRPELGRALDDEGRHLRAEIAYAFTHEGALHLEDVLERRTRLAITRADRALGPAPAVAALMAESLGWDDNRAERELAGWRRRVAALRAAETQRDDERALAAYHAVLAGASAPEQVSS